VLNHKNPSAKTLFRLYETEIAPFDVLPTSLLYKDEKEALCQELKRVLTVKSEQAACRILDRTPWGHVAFCVLVIRSWVGIKPSAKLCQQALQEELVQLKNAQQRSAKALKDLELIVRRSPNRGA
jgi:hypothetical protein